jgi:hypothetical protein
MDVKSKSKKVFTSATKFPIDPLIKRHKSQESYSDTKNIYNKNLKTPKSNIKEYTRQESKFKSISKSKTKLINLNLNSKLPVEEKKADKLRELSRQIFLNKEDDSVRQIETEENLNNGIQNTKNSEDIEGFCFDKIFMTNQISSFDEEDEACNLDEMEEMRSSQIKTDFYTNSIGEASCSILEKGKGLINILPKPFVKERGEKPNNNNEKLNFEKDDLQFKDDKEKLNQKVDHYYRMLLAYSKKGDREGFLDVLSKIYKVQGKNTNINFKDETGWSSLHYSSDEGNLKIVEILIKMNVDLNSKNINKKTPLHLAVEKGYFDISKILIENGASISLLDSEKNNVVHICSSNGHVELLKYLLDKHPQADTKNIYGKSPLDLAKNPKIVDLLKTYYSKNTVQYHKITIHDVSTNFTKSDKNSKSQKINLMKPAHNKFESIDSNYKNSPQNLQKSTNKKYLPNNIFTNNPAKLGKDNSTNLSGKSTETQNNVYKNIRASPKNILNKNPFDKVDESNEETIHPFSSIEEEKIGPSSFYCHALLGKGSFGEVYLVEKKNSKIFYAMKVLSKNKIMAQNLVKYAMTERNVLSVTDHPFIVKLSFAFQTKEKLFLILDYCPGGDLAEHLSKEKRFSEERAKIYLCEIILALEDLHKRDIIFRDLKPDNVVLDKEGHAMLTDFGLSKEGVLDNKCAKSFCGSIAYLAPEMLKRTGHGKSVDWYLLGVLFYEMVVGVPPYFTNNKYN